MKELSIVFIILMLLTLILAKNLKTKEEECRKTGILDYRFDDSQEWKVYENDNSEDHYQYYQIKIKDDLCIVFKEEVVHETDDLAHTTSRLQLNQKGEPRKWKSHEQIINPSGILDKYVCCFDLDS